LTMSHLRLISRTPSPAQQKATDIYETLILYLMAIIFQDWDNFQQVIQNLSKYYSKTP